MNIIWISTWCEFKPPIHFVLCQKMYGEQKSCMQGLIWKTFQYWYYNLNPKDTQLQNNVLFDSVYSQSLRRESHCESEELCNIAWALQKYSSIQHEHQNISIPKKEKGTGRFDIGQVSGAEANHKLDYPQNSVMFVI